MAKYDRLKKCKANGCPLSVEFVTERDGNGVCAFHHAALPEDWMAVRDRVVAHADFLILSQLFDRLPVRYRCLAGESVDVWLARVRRDVRRDVLQLGDVNQSLLHLSDLRQLLAVNSH